MHRIWTLVALALIGAVLVVAWGRRARSVPEPTSRVAEPAAGVQPKRLTRGAPADCRPLPQGGFSCGACREDTDCAEGAACVVNLGSGRTECQGSECQNSEACARGSFCRVVGKTSRGDYLRACVPPGVRPPGAACDAENGSDPTVSCGPNLLCVDGGCAPGCQPVEDEIEEPSTCPGGLACVSTPSGWGCTPTCKDTGCRDGKTCSFLSVEGPISLCTYADGRNCLGSKGGCATNQDCIVETDARAERTRFRCMDRCDPNAVDATCPSGSICVPGKPTGHCRQSCSSDHPGDCANGERCKKSGTGDDVWFCSAT